MDHLYYSDFFLIFININVPIIATAEQAIVIHKGIKLLSPVFEDDTLLDPDVTVLLS